MPQITSRAQWSLFSTPQCSLIDLPINTAFVGQPHKKLYALIENRAELLFLDYFNDLKDHRCQSSVFYPVEELLFSTLCAVICGADGWDETLLNKYFATKIFVRLPCLFS